MWENHCRISGILWMLLINYWTTCLWAMRWYAILHKLVITDDNINTSYHYFEGWIWVRVSNILLSTSEMQISLGSKQWLIGMGKGNERSCQLQTILYIFWWVNQIFRVKSSTKYLWETKLRCIWQNFPTVQTIYMTESLKNRG